MRDLLINVSTKKELENYLVNPSHALLIAGPAGSGRLAIAKMLASKLLATDKLEASGNFRLIEPDEKNTISIDRIRELRQFTRLKSNAPRVIVVTQADKMSLSAQNSFLKLLEEPPENTFIILIASASGLRPTVLSRLQKIVVRPVTPELARKYFDRETREIERIYRLSDGRLGLMSQLLERQDDHPLVLAASEARAILSGNIYERLLCIDSLSKDKIQVLAVLEVILRMAELSLRSASDETTVRRWQRVLAATYHTEMALEARVNLKLALTDFMLNL